MCGLAGEIRFDGTAPDVGAVARMTGCLRHRGPDGDGLWARGPVALGHRRLSIVDLSTAGAQPMVVPRAGLTIAYNGMVYNYRQLRDELHAKGHTFDSTSDTEVIVAAYAEWGTGFVEHLVGMFAIAIWEHASGRLVLARDRLGIKPLYVAEVPGGLRFASSLPAVLAGNGSDGGSVDTSIDPVAFASYMTFHSIVPAPRTILSGVGKLPPATVRVVEPSGAFSDTTYWEPRFARDPARADWSEQDWQDGFTEKLRTAVERRMVADVPVGVLLSGGIDSSLVVALLAEAGQQDLATFSIGFEAAGGESGDEFEYSDAVARHFGTDHHRIAIPSSRLLAGIDGAVAAMSEPMVSHDCVAFWLLSQEVSQHVKVVQSGQGADELLGGYSWYPPLAATPRDQAAEAYRSVFMDRRWPALQPLLGERWRSDDDTPSAFVDAEFARPGADTSVDAALRSDTTIMLVDDPVKRVDNMTMAWGLEARVPFLDHEFVEFAATIPPEQKLADGGKGVMKRAARGIVPDAVIDRTKGSFPVPAIRQLEGPYLERVRQALHAPEARERGLFDPGTVERMLQDPNGTRTEIGANALWQLGLIEMWLQHQGVR
jgi:asparagine synthase (glutamine-hydrolysing)